MSSVARLEVDIIKSYEDNSGIELFDLSNNDTSSIYIDMAWLDIARRRRISKFDFTQYLRGRRYLTQGTWKYWGC